MRLQHLLLVGFASFFVLSCRNTELPSRLDSEFCVRDVTRTKANRDCPEELKKQIEAARQSWLILGDSSKKEQWAMARKTYNDAIFTLVNYSRARLRNVVKVPESYPYVIAYEKDPVNKAFTPNLYRDVIPANLIRNNGSMDERYVQDGLGVANVGWIPPENLRGALPYLKDAGVFHNLTALLLFPENGKIMGRPCDKPALVFAHRTDHEFVKIGTEQISHPLVADYSASTLAAWSVSRLDNINLLSVFRPVQNESRYGLYFHEPYNETKIPIVLVHGLASSPQTFSDLINRLSAYPEIRRNYQFWCFSYPTGLPWVASARNLRHDLESLRQRLDPHKKNENWSKMVIVGHSMGGLITRYNLSKDPSILLKASMSKIIKDADSFRVKYSKNLSSRVQDSFEFEPLPASRAIFMAVPHKGSDIADIWLVRYVSKLIQLPTGILEEVTKIITLDQDMLLFNPEEIPQLFTSVNQLSPKSPFIQGLRQIPLKENLKVHTILGVNHSRRPLLETSDGVVSYHSSHFPTSISEQPVPSGHSLTGDYYSFLETLRILRLHLLENGRGNGLMGMENVPVPGRAVIDPDYPQSDVLVRPKFNLPN